MVCFIPGFLRERKRERERERESERDRKMTAALIEFEVQPQNLTAKTVKYRLAIARTSSQLLSFWL